jgi:hypothetical protein
LRQTRSTTVRVALALVAALASAARAEPIEVTGTVLGLADRQKVIDALGLTIRDEGEAIIAFDLAGVVQALGRGPNLFQIQDDGIPAEGPHVSGGPFTGVDVDAVAGLDAEGHPTFASAVQIATFGAELAPASRTIAECLAAQVDGLWGDAAAEGFPANVLGEPDAVLQSGGVASCDDLDISTWSGFTSVGSGGLLELVLPAALADANVVGDYDLFLFDAGGSGDGAVFRVDVLLEECGDCIDNDGDGAVDLDDPDCAFKGMGLRKVVSKVGKRAKLVVDATFGLLEPDDVRTGVTLGIGTSAGLVRCDNVPAERFIRNKKGTRLTYNGAATDVLRRLVLKTQKKQRATIAKVVLRDSGFPVDAPDVAVSLHLSGTRHLHAIATLRKKGQRLVLE